MTTPSRRAARAASTRAQILDAARKLFAERGYAHTGVREIAAAAGVSPQTVYDSIGSKSAIVASLNDQIDQETGIERIVGLAMASRDPETIAAVGARVSCEMILRCGDILRVVISGAASEPDLAAVMAEGHRRHVAGTRGIVEALASLDALAPGLTVAQAADTLAAVCDEQLAIMLIDQYGWSLRKVERWMAASCRRLLLADATG